jgi:hypothetical protein
MGGGVALLARGIWWRRWASLVLVLCASITVAGAAAGPLWGRASQASLLARTLDEARVSELAWTVTGGTDAYTGVLSTPPRPSLVASDVRVESQLPPGLNELFDDATEVIMAARRVQVMPLGRTKPPPGERPAGKLPLGMLVSREGACAQVELVAGGCPKRHTDLLLSSRSAKVLGVGAGGKVHLPELVDDIRPARPKALPATFTVSGVYRAQTVRTGSRFWFDSEDFEYAPPTAVGGEVIPARLDAVLVQPDVVLALRSVGVRVQVERVLRLAPSLSRTPTGWPST